MGHPLSHDIFDHVPPAIGLILQLLWSPIGSRKFQNKRKQNMATEWTVYCQKQYVPVVINQSGVDRIAFSIIPEEARVVVGDPVVAAHLVHVGRAVHLGARSVLCRAQRPLDSGYPLVSGQGVSAIETCQIIFEGNGMTLVNFNVISFCNGAGSRTTHKISC